MRWRVDCARAPRMQIARAVIDRSLARLGAHSRRLTLLAAMPSLQSYTLYVHAARCQRVVYLLRACLSLT